MLTSAKPMTFLGTTDRVRATAFFRDTLGLQLISEDHFAIVFNLAGTLLRVTPVKSVTPAQYTVLGWQVSDIETTVTALASSGVKFQKFGLPGQDDQGIWTAPNGDRVAWFQDPDGNILSVSQHV